MCPFKGLHGIGHAGAAQAQREDEAGRQGRGEPLEASKLTNSGRRQPEPVWQQQGEQQQAYGSQKGAQRELPPAQELTKSGIQRLGGHCSSATLGLYSSLSTTCRVIATVAAATAMKLGTEIQLRSEKRGRPQMPWPLVQPVELFFPLTTGWHSVLPLPTRVPMPTDTPSG